MKKLTDSTGQKEKQGLGIFEVLWGVLAAMFGVRDHEKHQRDFEQGDPIQFIVWGVLFVLAFVMTLIWIVDIILAESAM